LQPYVVFIAVVAVPTPVVVAVAGAAFLGVPEAITVVVVRNPVFIAALLAVEG
jgi:hypothetical protein